MKNIIHTKNKQCKYKIFIFMFSLHNVWNMDVNMHNHDNISYEKLWRCEYAAKVFVKLVLIKIDFSSGLPLQYALWKLKTIQRCSRWICIVKTSIWSRKVNEHLRIISIYISLFFKSMSPCCLYDIFLEKSELQ
jgi:hypothetical protein